MIDCTPQELFAMFGESQAQNALMRRRIQELEAELALLKSPADANDAKIWADMQSLVEAADGDQVV